LRRCCVAGGALKSARDTHETWWVAVVVLRVRFLHCDSGDYGRVVWRLYRHVRRVIRSEPDLLEVECDDAARDLVPDILKLPGVAKVEVL